jgi:glycosyltransferase involved in cell wall biosynthesis
MEFAFLTLGYHPDLIGGAYRYVAEVARRLAARHHKVDVLYPAPEGRSPGLELRAGVRLHRYRSGAGFFLANFCRENAAVRKVLQRLETHGPGQVLYVMCHAYYTPALAGRRDPVAFLFTGPWAEEYRLARRARPRSCWQRWFDELIAVGLRATERRGLRRAQRILTISQYYAGRLPLWHPGRLPPVTMISGGVDSEQFHPAGDRADLRARLGLGPDDFLFLTVRRLDPRMGLVNLIDSFASISAEHRHARLWLAGLGPQREELARRIAAARLESQVRLLGYVAEEQLPGLLSAADCTVMPSLDLEGFGLATVESLACGTPVIGSRAGATPELLVPLSPALVFDSGSSDALAAKLREVLARPEWLPNSQQCRDYVLLHYSWDGPVSALEQCHAHLCAKREWP